MGLFQKCPALSLSHCPDSTVPTTPHLLHVGLQSQTGRAVPASQRLVPSQEEFMTAEELRRLQDLFLPQLNSSAPKPHLSASPRLVKPEMTIGSKGSSVPEMVIPKGPPYRFSSTV